LNNQSLAQSDSNIDGSRTAPTDEGEQLATLDRGPGKQLRLRWKEFKGHHFLDVREWSRSEQGGDWWPVKGKGITIKHRELDAVIAALEAARGLS
jgi:hypothetical protein